MWHFLKLTGMTLCAIAGIALAIGVGAAIAALSTLIGTALLGGGVILVIILMVRELFDGK